MDRQAVTNETSRKLIDLHRTITGRNEPRRQYEQKKTEVRANSFQIFKITETLYSITVGL